MGAAHDGKLWEYPYELMATDLEQVIELLWATYAFDDGSKPVHDMLKACELELYRRRTVVGAHQIRKGWSTSGWPIEGTPVLEIVYGWNCVKSVRVVNWTIAFMGLNPYTYTEDHHYDPSETNP